MEKKAKFTESLGDETDEIEQIMSEIDNLKLGMEVEPKSQPKLRAVPRVEESEEHPHEQHHDHEDDVMREFREGAGGSDGGMEETLGSVKEEVPASGKTIFDTESDSNSDLSAEEDSMGRTGEVRDLHESQEHETDSEHAYDGSSGHSAENSLSMTLSGKMSLKLKYEFSGQEVTLQFTDEGLRVVLGDGAEFKVPVRPSHHPAPRKFRKAG